MHLESLTKYSIDYVFDDLWPRGVEELRKLGIPVEQEKAFFVEMIGKPFTGAAIDREGAPCALIALQPHGEIKWTSHFAATETGFKNAWLPLSIFLRKLSSRLAKDGGTIQVRSAFGDGDVRQWFEVMGFQYRGYAGPCHFYSKG